MCAPVARKARARDQDRNLRSASTSIPGPKQCSRSRASGCSADRYGPMAAPSRLPVPDSAAATHRTCGNAPSLDWFDGRPKNASFSLLSGTSVTDPSTDTTRSPQQNTPGAPSAPVGPATCSNSIRTGCRAELAAPAGQGGDVRLPPPPAVPGIDPAARVQLPGQQVRAAPLVIQPVGQLGHHLPVPAVPAPEQPQAPARSTPSAGPAAAGGAAPGSPSPQRPHQPGPAGTPWSAPLSRSGPAASRPATDPQHHHEPQNGHNITSRP